MKKIQNEQVEITKELGDIMKISYDLELVNYNAKNNLQGLIDASEKMYYRQIANIVNEIVANGSRVILVAGPSCAGKTTSSKKIRIGLKRKGINAHIVSLDDFLFDKVNTPKLPDGSYDFENVNILDLPLFKKFLKDILATGKAKIPQYNFISDKREGFKNITLRENEKLIVEGLHALNPLFTESFSSKNFYKVFVSVSSNFILGKNVIINNRDLRFMRRMLRDYHKRGTSIKESALTWKNVCKGEDEFITCFKTSVNYILNTTHAYEILLYDKYLKPLTKKYKGMEELNVVFNTFDKTSGLDKKFVPKNSLLWEFLPKD